MFQEPPGASERKIYFNRDDIRSLREEKCMFNTGCSGIAHDLDARLQNGWPSEGSIWIDFTMKREGTQASRVIMLVMVIPLASDLGM